MRAVSCFAQEIDKRWCVRAASMTLASNLRRLSSREVVALVGFVVSRQGERYARPLGFTTSGGSHPAHDLKGGAGLPGASHFGSAFDYKAEEIPWDTAPLPSE